MLRFLQVNEAKNIQILSAGAALKRGAPVTIDYTDNTVDNASATGEFFLVDAVENSDGTNAIYHTDSSFENIASGDACLVVPTYIGERYATTELTIGSLSKGDALKASSGKFIAGAQNDVCEWAYGGTYSDPTGLTMYIVERIPAVKVS